MKQTVNGKSLAEMAAHEERCFEVVLAKVELVSGLVVLLKRIVGLRR